MLFSAVHITAVTRAVLQHGFHCVPAAADDIAHDEVLNGLSTYLIWPESQNDYDAPNSLDTVGFMAQILSHSN